MTSTPTEVAILDCDAASLLIATWLYQQQTDLTRLLLTRACSSSGERLNGAVFYFIALDCNELHFAHHFTDYGLTRFCVKLCEPCSTSACVSVGNRTRVRSTKKLQVFTTRKNFIATFRVHSSLTP